jgi:hypothetical protein
MADASRTLPRDSGAMPHRFVLLLAAALLLGVLTGGCRESPTAPLPDLPEPGEHSPRRTQ